MNWLALARLLLSLVLQLIEQAKRSKQIKEGEALAVAKAIKETADAIDKMSGARTAAERDFDEHGVRDDDPNLRD